MNTTEKPKKTNYAESEKAPVCFHAVDQPLVNALHAELRTLKALLDKTCGFPLTKPEDPALGAKWEKLVAIRDDATQDRWTECPQYPMSAWNEEAGANDTRLGYWDWVWHQSETELDG